MGGKQGYPCILPRLSGDDRVWMLAIDAVNPTRQRFAYLRLYQSIYIPNTETKSVVDDRQIWRSLDTCKHDRLSTREALRDSTLLLLWH
jgi:hypothetical protein